MKKEIRTVVYDEELRLEAYRFEGIAKAFPNHFHEHYVIGLFLSEYRMDKKKIKINFQNEK